MSACTRWCYTLNNYTIEEFENLENLQNSDIVTYHVFGQEHTNPGEGTPHIQGYIHLNKRIRLNQLKQLLQTDRIHAEPAKGSEEQNRTYCTKEGNYIEQGHPNLPKANPWDDIRRLEKQGAFDEIADLYPGLYHAHRSAIFAECLTYQELPTYDQPLPLKNFWYYGPPRTGKSKKVRDDNSDIYLKNCNKWWDGYHGQQCVLIEDLDPTTAKYLTQHMKIWADRYPFVAELKGAHMTIAPANYKLYITSNYSIEECFTGIDLDAIKARFQPVRFTSFP